jgi:hypothetical protein
MTSIVMFVAVLSFVSLSWAAVLSGEVTKIDDKASVYMIKDAKGKEHKVHFDKTTVVTGEIKVGAMVEVDAAKGHAKSIKVAEKK